MWKTIEQYPNYLINENGEIFSTHSNKRLRPSISGGYLHVTLIKDGERSYPNIHRLVAMAFVENPQGLPCVNHKDENKLNNNASNLEWCTYQYNNTYHERHYKSGEKLWKPVDQFDATGNLVGTYVSVKAAAESTGVREQGIAQAARGVRKTYKGYVWKWAELKQGESLRIR